MTYCYGDPTKIPIGGHYGKDFQTPLQVFSDRAAQAPNVEEKYTALGEPSDASLPKDTLKAIFATPWGSKDTIEYVKGAFEITLEPMEKDALKEGAPSLLLKHLFLYKRLNALFAFHGAPCPHFTPHHDVNEEHNTYKSLKKIAHLFSKSDIWFQGFEDAAIKADNNDLTHYVDSMKPNIFDEFRKGECASIGSVGELMDEIRKWILRHDKTAKPVCEVPTLARFGSKYESKVLDVGEPLLKIWQNAGTRPSPKHVLSLLLCHYCWRHILVKINLKKEEFFTYLVFLEVSNLLLEHVPVDPIAFDKNVWAPLTSKYEHNLYQSFTGKAYKAKLTSGLKGQKETKAQFEERKKAQAIRERDIHSEYYRPMVGSVNEYVYEPPTLATLSSIVETSLNLSSSQLPVETDPNRYFDRNFEKIKQSVRDMDAQSGSMRSSLQTRYQQGAYHRRTLESYEDLIEDPKQPVSLDAVRSQNDLDETEKAIEALRLEKAQKKAIPKAPVVSQHKNGKK